MQRYLVTYSNGSATVIWAYSPKDALIEAEEQATRDGHPGLSAVSAELVR